MPRLLLARCTSLCNFQFTLFPFFAFRFCFCFCLLCFISCCCCSCSFAVVLVCEQLDWKLYTINFRSQNCKQAITFFAIVLRNYLSQFWMIDLSICRGNWKIFVLSQSIAHTHRCALWRNQIQIKILRLQRRVWVISESERILWLNVHLRQICKTPRDLIQLDHKLILNRVGNDCLILCI